MAIEILENTLLKLLVRRGTNQDRKQIVLDTGELGYTTDMKRLYIGDGVTPGGVLVGNKWAGNNADLTNLAPVLTGDYGYDTDNHEIKICTKGTGAVANDWTTVANLISAANTTIVIDAANRIEVGKLSAGNIDFDALGNSLTLDGSERVALSATININTITQRDSGITSYLNLPGRLKVRSIDYTFPPATPQTGTFLGYNTPDAAGGAGLAWKVPKVVYSAVAPTTAALIPVGTIVPYVSAAAGAPYGWLNCNGQAVNAVTYSELLTAVGIGYGRDFAANTFNVPNLSSTMVYGWTVPGQPPSLSPMFTVSATPTSTDPSHGYSGLSAVGMSFIIKAFGGVTNPTLTVGKNLSASIQAGPGHQSFDKTNITFNPLSGAISITRPTPGIKMFTNPGTDTFTMPNGITYVKFYVTGSGAAGGTRTGNAGSTAVGYISARPGTVFYLTVAARPDDENGAQGHASSIGDPADATNIIVTAPGGRNGTDVPATPTVAESVYLPTGTITIKGGVGNVDTDYKGGTEEALGASSFWGGNPAWGGGQASHGGKGGTRYAPTDIGIRQGPLPSAGIILFEWN